MRKRLTITLLLLLLLLMMRWGAIASAQTYSYTVTPAEQKALTALASQAGTTPAMVFTERVAEIFKVIKEQAKSRDEDDLRARYDGLSQADRARVDAILGRP